MVPLPRRGAAGGPSWASNPTSFVLGVLFVVLFDVMFDGISSVCVCVCVWCVCVRVFNSHCG